MKGVRRSQKRNKMYGLVCGYPNHVFSFIYKQVPFIGRVSNSEMHSWASRVLIP